MIKHNLKTMIITTIVILLPLVAFALLWDQLPEQIPYHWGISGEVDGWVSKGPELLFMPLFMVAIQWICAAATGADPKHENHTEKMLLLALWICPVLSLIVHSMILASALGMNVSVEVFLPLVLGGLFVIVGNYMPKCKQNYTIGIKIVWTLDSEANWNATHRFAGWVWTIGGLLIMTLSFFGNFWLLLAMMLPLVFAPMVYSYRYYRKHRKEN